MAERERVRRTESDGDKNEEPEGDRGEGGEEPESGDENEDDLGPAWVWDGS